MMLELTSNKSWQGNKGIGLFIVKNRNSDANNYLIFIKYYRIRITIRSSDRTIKQQN